MSPSHPLPSAYHLREKTLATLSAALIALGGLSGCAKEETKKSTVSSDISITVATTGNSPFYQLSTKGKEYSLHFVQPESREKTTFDHLYISLNNCIPSNEQRELFSSVYARQSDIRKLKPGNTLTFSRNPNESAFLTMRVDRKYLVQKHKGDCYNPK